MATEPVASVRGITRRFGNAVKPALDSVSLTIEPGVVTGLVGPDGAGKTTLIRVLTGLLLPDSGTVEVLGTKPGGAGQADVGYMPQRFGLYEDLTVAENLRLYANLRGLPREEQPDVFARLLAFTDLARFQDRLSGKLSGGMKQKLGLACALVKTPTLLLLDEPGVGVDPISRRELWSMVEQLTGEGIGVLWSTAYLDEAQQCDVVHLLNEGNLLFSGAPKELTDRVADRVYKLTGFGGSRRKLLERALDSEAILDGTIEAGALRLLFAQGSSPQANLPVEAATGAKLELVPARFEDGFIDILGGGPRGPSALAEGYREIPPADDAAIEAIGLTKRFGDFVAADDINFTIPRGEIFGLLGPNGAGKSTTFKMLCGLLTPTSGVGRVAGHDLRASRAAARSSLGYMAQKFSLYGDLSVEQNLDFFAGAYDLDRRQARTQIGRMVEIFDLGRFLSDNSGSLPLGYKQRLALACAVLHEPGVLFLDEPTSGVDPITRREFWMHINGLVEKGVTVLVTTHFMDEAEYCDRIALIYRSRTVAQGTPGDLRQQAVEAGAENPTLEDAFIHIVQASGADAEERQAA